MQDKFWTPELWCEFINQGPLISALETEMEQFKSSKSPKKEWEVVAFKYLPNGDIITNTQKFEWDFAMNGDGLYTIHSVRRLSDGEVFSTGDRIKDLRGSIISFEIDSAWGGGLGIRLDSGDADCIQLAQKLPQGIFVTTDGVEMRDKMDYILVTETFDLVHMIATRTDNWKPNFKTFSTRQAAETYILNNRPLLSLNDVKEAAKKYQIVGTGYMVDRLAELVKQKLNQ